MTISVKTNKEKRLSASRHGHCTEEDIKEVPSGSLEENKPGGTEHQWFVRRKH